MGREETHADFPHDEGVQWKIRQRKELADCRQVTVGTKHEVRRDVLRQFLDLSEKAQVLLFSTLPSVFNGLSNFRNCFSKVYRGAQRSFKGTKNGMKLEKS